METTTTGLLLQIRPEIGIAIQPLSQKPPYQYRNQSSYRTLRHSCVYWVFIQLTLGLRSKYPPPCDKEQWNHPEQSCEQICLTNSRIIFAHAAMYYNSEVILQWWPFVSRETFPTKPGASNKKFFLFMSFPRPVPMSFIGEAEIQSYRAKACGK